MVNGTNNASAPGQPASGQPAPQQPYGVIGFVPIIFYPNCGNGAQVQQQIQPMFPYAIAVPYSCASCGQGQAIARSSDKLIEAEPEYTSGKRRRNIRRRLRTHT
jgi:hypothetical protein